MALKRITNVKETKPTIRKSDHPTFQIEGTNAQKFIVAVKDMKDAEARLASARLALLNPAIEQLFNYNVTHETLVKTVEVMDEAGEVVRLTSQNKYSAANPDAADALFEDLGKKYKKAKIDINDYVQETVTASFDSKVFNGADGRFSLSIYAAYAKAIEGVTADLIKKSAISERDSPLQTSKKILPLTDFDTRRYRDFPSVEDQKRISEVLANTVTLTPSV